MSKTLSKRAVTCSFLILSFIGAGCAGTPLAAYGHGSDGLGQQGFADFSYGNFPEAERQFSADFQNHPGNPLAQFNLADSYRQRGDLENADALYRLAAAGGKAFIPDDFLEPHDSRTTVRDLACGHLAEDNQSDPNCLG